LNLFSFTSHQRPLTYIYVSISQYFTYIHFFLQFSFYCIWRIHSNVLIIYYIDKLKHGKTSRKGWEGMIINTWTIWCSTLCMILIQIHACIFSHITHIEWFIILIISNTCNKFSSTFFLWNKLKINLLGIACPFIFFQHVCVFLTLDGMRRQKGWRRKIVFGSKKLEIPVYMWR